MSGKGSGTAATVPAGSGIELVLEREFEASRDTVFRMWTEAEHFARWWGPHGSTMRYCRIEGRTGGDIHFRHHVPEIGDVWVRGRYEEVVPPERIVFTCYFSDEEGRKRDREGFPKEMRIAVTFEESGGGTTVTIRQTGLMVDQGELQGWTEGLDRLGDYLAERPGSI